MKKTYLKGNVFILTLMLVSDVWYMFSGDLFAKTIASVMFLITGIVNFVYCIENKADLEFPRWMVMGLTFAMLADVILVLNFYIGAIVFAIAHIFYILSFCILEKINRKDLICGVGIFAFALSVIQLTPFLEFGSSLMKNICYAYALIISLMVGKAVSNLLKENNTTNMTIVIGSILFFISNLMFMFNEFGNILGASYLCLGTYYLGQFILAFSLFRYATVGSLVDSLNSKKNAKVLKVS